MRSNTHHHKAEIRNDYAEIHEIEDNPGNYTILKQNSNFLHVLLVINLKKQAYLANSVTFIITFDITKTFLTVECLIYSS